jgi:hypothetical protein
VVERVICIRENFEKVKKTSAASFTSICESGKSPTQKQMLDDGNRYIYDIGHI